jgi:hypothetical protein
MSVLAPLLVVVRRLGSLRDRVVFVGGMIRGLLITDPGAPPERPTDDLEDIVAVIDGRAELQAELAATDIAVRRYVANELQRLLDTPAFLEALPGHLRRRGQPGAVAPRSGASRGVGVAALRARERTRRGTTAAGLRAGKPTLVTAFFGDQLFWGRRVARAGAGPMPILRRQIDATKLADGIAQTLGNASYRDGAERLAKALSREDGVASAVAVVKSYIGKASALAAPAVA